MTESYLLALSVWFLQAPVADTWGEFLGQPYSEDAFLDHAESTGQNPTGEFREWYISGVYRAKQGKKPPKWVVQIYDGSKRRFRLGWLVVFGARGEHLRTIARERVHWSLLAADADFELPSKSAREKIVVDLPDLNGDSFAEIPTQRWKPVQPHVPAREPTSIYLTNAGSIPCAFCVEFYNRWPAAELERGHLYLHFAAQNGKNLKLSSPIYVRTGTGFVKADLPHRQLATFV